MKPFDTLSYCKQLEAAGIPREQAEVQAQALGEVMSQIVTTAQTSLIIAALRYLPH